MLFKYTLWIHNRTISTWQYALFTFKSTNTALFRLHVDHRIKFLIYKIFYNQSKMGSRPPVKRDRENTQLDGIRYVSKQLAVADS